MLKLVWHSTTIKTNKQANEMIALFKKIQPKVGGFDTEANGLHITNAKMFLFQFGFINPNLKEGYTFAVDIEQQPELSRAVIRAWHKLAETLDIYLAHNIKFDLHMLLNYGEPYTKENVSDTMFYIRYAHNALTEDNGGPPLGLKKYAAKYIDRTARYHEKLLSNEKSQIVKDLHLKLKYRLNDCSEPPAKYKAKSYTLGVIKSMFSDAIVDYTDLPDDVRARYIAWLEEDVPIYIRNKVTGLVEADMIPYNKLNRQNLITYAHYDIIYLLEIYLLTAPIVTARGNEKGLLIENSLIYPFLEMERTGFSADKDYINSVQPKMKSYIKNRRSKIYDIAGMEFSISQHALIKKIFNEKFNLELPSTSSEVLESLYSDLKRENNTSGAIEFIEILQELRTLEKWYSTYVMRFIYDLKSSDRLYTTINQVGTVSGRVTSDFQQFPKDAIKTVDGEELFKPRRMIKTSGGRYNAIIYLDYSQIELRFQAFYTILVGHPDTNLCRAYMPYMCVDSDNRLFDCTSISDIRNWHSKWYYKELPNKAWEATDVHGATTKKAFDIDEHHPDFKKLRYIGKRVNFAKNYGAQRGKIREMFPEYSEEQITKINDAYYLAFPGVKKYHDYCYARAEQFSYTENLFGIKYYGVSGHKLINLLVQGSAAFYLKQKIRELYDYSKSHNIKSRIQMQIHDELSWEVSSEDDAELFFKYQEIMEDWEDTYVPIVADMECTKTTWAEKKEVNNIDELREMLNE